MSWSLFGIAVVATYLVQGGVVAVLDPRLFGQPFIDLLLALVLVYGLLAPIDGARIAGLLIGLAADLGNTGAFGVHTFACGLAVLMVTAWRETLRVNRWPVRLALCAAAGTAAQIAIAAHRWFWQGTGEPAGLLLAGVLLTGVTAALIASVVVVLPGFPRQRPRARGFSGR